MADITSICNQALAAVGTRTSIASISEASNEARQCLLQYEPTKRQLLRAAHWGFARAYTKLNLYKARIGTPENDGSVPPLVINPLGITPLIDPPGNGGNGNGEEPPAIVWNPDTEPPPPWSYAYTIPQGCLAIRYILPVAASGQPAIPFFGTTDMSYPDFWLGAGAMVKFEMASISNVVLNGPMVLCILSNQQKALACFTRDVSDPTQFDESFSRALVQGLAANMSQALTGDLKLLDALIKMTNSLILDARVKSANEGFTVNDVVPDWHRVRGVGPAVGTGPWIAEYGPLFGGAI